MAVWANFLQRTAMPAATCRLMASETACARSQDSLHFRCLARIRLASGGGSAAFWMKRAASASCDITDLDTAQPFDPIARLNV